MSEFYFRKRNFNDQIKFEIAVNRFKAYSKSSIAENVINQILSQSYLDLKSRNHM